MTNTSSTEKAPGRLGFLGSNRRILDLIEQLVVIGVYLSLIVRIWPSSLTSANLHQILIILSEGMILAFLILRRPTENISVNPRDWAYAFAGSFLPLMISVGGTPIAPRLGICLLVFGLFFHVGAKLSLRRSFGLVAADRGVKDDGLYRFMRHPMYAGYFIVHIGYLLVAPTLRNLAIYVSVWVFLGLRVIAEEKILSQNPKYVAYKENVHYRIIPGLF